MGKSVRQPPEFWRAKSAVGVISKKGFGHHIADTTAHCLRVRAGANSATTLTGDTLKANVFGDGSDDRLFKNLRIRLKDGQISSSLDVRCRGFPERSIEVVVQIHLLRHSQTGSRSVKWNDGAATASLDIAVLVKDDIQHSKKNGILERLDHASDRSIGLEDIFCHHQRRKVRGESRECNINNLAA